MSTKTDVQYVSPAEPVSAPKYILEFQEGWVHLFRDGSLIEYDHNQDLILMRLFELLGADVKITHLEDYMEDDEE